jgi:hypothetical protein
MLCAFRVLYFLDIGGGFATLTMTVLIVPGSHLEGANSSTS